MSQSLVDELSPLLEAKRIWREVFRDQQSVIPMDIVLLTVWYHSKGPALSMKHLVAELPYSEAGIKYHLRQLETDGLIAREPDPKDGRVVRLVPSDLLIERVLSVARAFRSIFTDGPRYTDGALSMAEVFAGNPPQNPTSLPPPRGNR